MDSNYTLHPTFVPKRIFDLIQQDCNGAILYWNIYLEYVYNIYVNIYMNICIYNININKDMYMIYIIHIHIDIYVKDT